MKIIKALVLSGLLAPLAMAQAGGKATNSFFDDSPVKEYSLTSLVVAGDVAEPGPVELAGLPLRETAVKELGWADGKPAFKGAYFITGYSLYDILDAKKVKKPEGAFKPETDLYVTVENAKGEKAVFSWGEIYYSGDNFKTLLTKTVRSVNPAKRDQTWPLPEAARLVCANDLYNGRFISEPVKITVSVAPGTFAEERTKKRFSPDIKIIAAGKTAAMAEFPAGAERRSLAVAGYGHGTGFKGLKEAEGVVFKNILIDKTGLKAQEAGDKLVVISARDGYRGAFSLSELINRGDSEDFLLLDRGDSEEDGRYSLFVIPDFYVDRNIRSVEKVEIVKI